MTNWMNYICFHEKQGELHVTSSNKTTYNFMTNKVNYIKLHDKQGELHITS